MAKQAAVRYTRQEEIANGLTHGLGAVAGLAALFVLVGRSVQIGDAWRATSFGIYGTSLTLLYLSSCCYHSARSEKWKQLLRVFDHASIFLLIAGTYTPVCLVSLDGGWRWVLFGLIWATAIVGIIKEVFFIERFKRLTIGLYVGMGWLALIAIKPLIDAMETGALIWMAAGGVFYTGGVSFYVWKKLPYNHAIWHVFVLAGSVCHFVMFFVYLLPNDKV